MADAKNDRDIVSQLVAEQERLESKLSAVKVMIALYSDTRNSARGTVGKAKQSEGLWAAIRDAVKRADKPVRATDISDELRGKYPGVDSASIRQCLSGMCRTGQLKRVSRGAYTMARQKKNG